MHLPSVMTVLGALSTTLPISNDVMTDSLVAAIHAVHSSCNVNTDYIKQYTGGPLLTTTINNETMLVTFASIHGAQLKILNDGIITPELTEANTARCINTVLDTLWTSVPGTVDAMVAKIDLFQKEDGLFDAAKNSLELLLHNHIVAGKAIEPKICRKNATLLGLLEREVTEVTIKLQEGVETFRKASEKGVSGGC